MVLEINDYTPRQRRSGGRRALDTQRLARALRGPTLDTRIWISSGTIGVINEAGQFLTSGDEARLAVYVDAFGALINVRLEPSGEMVTARWSGVGVGRFGRIIHPLYPGDEVLVLVPGGDLNSPAVAIVGTLSNFTARLPDNWANDRTLIDIVGDLDIRAGSLRLNSANLLLNGRRVVRGTNKI